jgi:hypothetical protein
MFMVSVLAAIVVLFLAWNLYRRFAADHVQVFLDRHRAASRFASRGVLFDGNRHIDVALSLDQNTFFYENRGMQASIDLQWVREVEYDTKLITGAPTAGKKVLRLRSPSQVFEFLLDENVAQKWHLILPQRSRPDVVAPVASADQSRAEGEGWPVVPVVTQG